MWFTNLKAKTAFVQCQNKVKRNHKTLSGIQIPICIPSQIDISYVPLYSYTIHNRGRVHFREDITILHKSQKNLTSHSVRFNYSVQLIIKIIPPCKARASSIVWDPALVDLSAQIPLFYYVMALLSTSPCKLRTLLIGRSVVTSMVL